MLNIQNATQLLRVGITVPVLNILHGLTMKMFFLT